ncbi:hypothetical protein Y032_0601g508 [Ancylostoma ceylanicum]|uniref:Uncharacterized protein n=2 Tax=Ancylostoma ceylanicum TaxID=53326 RepID=A0A016WN48_9BILA|nr:hypothetical protein Y032_0601g508 [Ancylostoma ceylanicum]
MFFFFSTSRLSNAPSIECRSLCTRIIGLASCFDEHIMKDHLTILHRSLETDVCEVKDSALAALADIISVYGFSEIAKLMFGEDPVYGSQDERNPPVGTKPPEQLAKLFEDTFDGVSDAVLPSLASTCLRVLNTMSLNWPAMLGRILLRVIESKSEKLEDVTTSFLAGFTKKGRMCSVQIVMALLWCVAKVQLEEISNQTNPIPALSSYVREFLEDRTGPHIKRTRSKAGKEAAVAKKEEVKIFPSMLLCRGVLHRLLLEPWGSTARSLANILSTLHIQDVDTPSLPPLHSHLDIALEVIEKEGLVRLAAPLRRFVGNVENLMRRRNCKFEQRIFKKKVKREVSEDWDPSWSVKFSPKTPKTPKISRSIKREPSSRIPTQNPSELPAVTPVPAKEMVASVKKSLSELHRLQNANNSDVFIVESDEGDFEPAQTSMGEKQPKVSKRKMTSTASLQGSLSIKRSKSSTKVIV